MANSNDISMRVNRKLIYVLVTIPIVSMTIVGLWSLNADYILFIRESAIDYIKRYHPETINLLIHLTWSGGKAEMGGVIGSELYVYASKGWIIEINYPVVSNPEYQIKAEYFATEVDIIGVPKKIIWEGKYKDNNITEKSYTLIQ